MQRRVAIARALAGQSKILLLDEPLSGIDIDSRTTIKRLFIELRNQTDNHLTLAEAATLLVTHDIAEAVAICSRIVILNRGITTKIKDVRRVDLPFPRHESSDAFQSICQSVLKVLLSPANGS